MAIILDSSGLLAAIDENEEDHIPTRESLAGAPGLRVISPFVLAELDYMLTTRFGQTKEIARSAYHLAPFSSDDVSDAIEVIERYADFAVGLADASNVVLSRKHETNAILTLDERRFRTLRGYRDRPFRILPADA